MTWQFGGGEVGEAAEHDSQAASIWDANPFDTSQYFSLPAPPIPSEDFLLRTTQSIQDRYAVAMGRGHGKSAFVSARGVWQNDGPSEARWSSARKDAFEVHMQHDWQLATLNRRSGRITGIDVAGDGEHAIVTLEQPYGVMAGGDLSFQAGDRIGIRRSYARKEIDLYAEGSKPNLVITSPGIAKAMRSVYADFAGKLLAESAVELKAEIERTLFTPQEYKDRLKGRTWSFYGENAADDRHDVPEAEAQRLMLPSGWSMVGGWRDEVRPHFQWQDLPPELHAQL